MENNCIKNIQQKFTISWKLLSANQRTEMKCCLDQLLLTWTAQVAAYRIPQCFAIHFGCFCFLSSVLAVYSYKTSREKVPVFLLSLHVESFVFFFSSHLFSWPNFGFQQNALHRTLNYTLKFSVCEKSIHQIWLANVSEQSNVRCLLLLSCSSVRLSFTKCVRKCLFQLLQFIMTADPVVRNGCSVMESAYFLLGLRLFLQFSCRCEGPAELGMMSSFDTQTGCSTYGRK